MAKNAKLSAIAKNRPRSDDGRFKKTKASNQQAFRTKKRKEPPKKGRI